MEEEEAVVDGWKRVERQEEKTGYGLTKAESSN